MTLLVVHLADGEVLEVELEDAQFAAWRAITAARGQTLDESLEQILREFSDQVLAAHALIGQRVRWAHDVCGQCGPLRVVRATPDGMVELDGWTGQFSPSGFVIVEE